MVRFGAVSSEDQTKNRNNWFFNFENRNRTKPIGCSFLVFGFNQIRFGFFNRNCNSYCKVQFNSDDLEKTNSVSH